MLQKRITFFTYFYFTSEVDITRERGLARDINRRLPSTLYTAVMSCVLIKSSISGSE